MDIMTQLIKSNSAQGITNQIWHEMANGSAFLKGKINGQIRNDGQGHTVRWDVVRTTLQGNKVIESPPNIGQYDLSAFTFEIIDDDPSFWPNVI